MKGRKSKTRKGGQSAPAFTVDFTGSSGAVQVSTAVSGAYDEAGVSFAAAGDGFNVSVRNREHMLSLRPRRTRDRLQGLLEDAAPALVLAASFGLLLEMAEAGSQMIYALAGVAVYIALTMAGRRLNERTRRIIILVLIAASAATLVVFRDYILSGMALIMNQLYDIGEQEQAYVYTRWAIREAGEEQPNISMHAAVLWVSVVLGCVLGIPGIRHQRGVSAFVFGMTLLAFAYYGILPSLVWGMVMAAAMLVSAGNGRIISSWPLFLAVALAAGGIVMLDPGENYAVSAFDENFRDVFATRGGFFENIDNIEEEDIDQPDNSQNDEEFTDDVDNEDEANIYTAAAAAAAGLAVLAGIYLIHRYLARRRKKNRAGIDDKDPNIAIGALFPYAVRWLRACGIDVENRSFADVGNSVRERLPAEYAEAYAGMHSLWKEAAFSDHVMSEENRTAMNDFAQKTMKLARSRAGIKEKLKIRFKYAL